MAATRTSAGGLALITRFEGVVLHYYNDPVGFCTVGAGHLVRRSRCTARELSTNISMSRAMTILRGDVSRFERAVRAIGVPLNQNRFDALVSIAFNCGEGAIGPGSTIYRRLKAGDYDGAADAFMLWTKAEGRTLQGLVTRRRAERALFNRRPVQKKADPLAGYPADERRWIREYDSLKARNRDSHRREVLQRVMKQRRGDIYRQAQRPPRGDGHGWDFRLRRKRWNSLRARTPK